MKKTRLQLRHDNMIRYPSYNAYWEVIAARERNGDTMDRKSPDAATELVSSAQLLALLLGNTIVQTFSQASQLPSLLAYTSISLRSREKHRLMYPEADQRPYNGEGHRQRPRLIEQNKDELLCENWTTTSAIDQGASYV
jgi:hypothetical protein